MSFAQTAKRPLTHKDYDSWRTIAGQHLSSDGKFLAYAMFPEEGDGEVVIRDLVTGKDTHFPAGARPLPAGASTEEGPRARSARHDDSLLRRQQVRDLLDLSKKADTDKARKEKKTADQMPKDGMTIVELASGKSTSIERVKRFALPEKAAGYVAYQKEAPERAVQCVGRRQTVGRWRRRGSAGWTAEAVEAVAVAPVGRGAEFGSDMVVRSLADGTERTFADVAEFHFTEDGKLVVYAVSARDTAKNGVFRGDSGVERRARDSARRQGQVLQTDVR
ncbi:MAG: hypothetical protein WDO73_25735 [Ignavibacteriota bacterium]